MQHAAMFDFNVTDCSEKVVSVSNIVDRGGTVLFSPSGTWISNASGVKLDITRKNKRWYLPYRKPNEEMMHRPDVLAPVQDEGWSFMEQFDPDAMGDEQEETLNQVPLEE